jgi:arginase
LAQLTSITATALAADGCAGWSVCIYNPDLDPGRDGADKIISFITQAISTPIGGSAQGGPR